MNLNVISQSQPNKKMVDEVGNRRERAVLERRRSEQGRHDQNYACIGKVDRADLFSTIVNFIVTFNLPNGICAFCYSSDDSSEDASHVSLV